MIKEMHNPDVLNCLANLSSDEVFTSPKIANEMLDMLPQELFSNPNTTFLDPCCKSGVFLREIAKRLLVGLEKQIPDLQERINHIFTKQLYGIAITQLTSLLSRRSVYCSKTANGKYSIVDKFLNDCGNIKYSNCKHSWNEDYRCEFCGVTQNSETYKREGMEVYAYEFIHTYKPEELFNMKFDVIIGNPPYQLACMGGGSTDRALPVYNKFIEQAIKLKPRFLTMIIPSKWMVGGFGLQKFRELMINCTKIEKLVDYEESSQCFNNVHIDGGVCYFLYNRDYNGPVDYKFISKNNLSLTKVRYLNTGGEYIIRNNFALSIIEKINNCKKFSEIVSTMNPFNIESYLFNSPERFINSKLSFEPFKNSVKIFGVKGIKGGARRTSGYIDKAILKCNRDLIEKPKILFSCTYSTGAINFPEEIIAGKNEICTSTFLLIGPFDNNLQRNNCQNYMHTNFFKVLLYLGKGTMHVTKSVFDYIPMQDFSKPWTDEELYKKYNLTQEEIDFIESMIKPMD